MRPQGCNKSLNGDGAFCPGAHVLAANRIIGGNLTIPFPAKRRPFTASRRLPIWLYAQPSVLEGENDFGCGLIIIATWTGQASTHQELKACLIRRLVNRYGNGVKKS